MEHIVRGRDRFHALKRRRKKLGFQHEEKKRKEVKGLRAREERKQEDEHGAYGVTPGDEKGEKSRRRNQIGTRGKEGKKKKEQPTSMCLSKK